MTPFKELPTTTGALQRKLDMIEQAIHNVSTRTPRGRKALARMQEDQLRLIREITERKGRQVALESINAPA